MRHPTAITPPRERAAALAGALIASAAVLLPPTPGRASCATADTCDTAAKAAFANGRLEEALASWRAAQAQRPSASVEFNIANVLAFLGETDDAITAFERFVGDHPDDARRPLALRLLAQLRDRARTTLRIEAARPGTPVQIADGAAAHDGTAPMTRAIDPRRPVQIRIGEPPDARIWQPLPDYEPWGWYSLGAGVILTGVAITFAALAEGDRDDADALSAQAVREGDGTAIRVEDVNDRFDAAATKDGIAVATGILAVAGLTAGGVLLWLDAELPAEGRIEVGPTGLSAGWTF